MTTSVDVALALVINQRNILICQRFAENHLGGFWEFPGGKIDPDEPPDQCALRELREETGVEARIIEPWPIVKFQYPTRLVQLYPFLCRYAAGEARPIACRNPTWVELSRLNQFIFPQANDSLLVRLQALNLPV